VAGKADSDLSASGAQVRVVLVQAREDLEMAREVRRVLATAEAGSSSGTRGGP